MIAAHVAAWSMKRDKPEIRAYVDGSTDAPRKKKKKKEVVLETKGGSQPVPQPNPIQDARAQIMIDESRRTSEADARAIELEREEQQRQTDILRTTDRTTQAYNSALNYGKAQISGRGLVPGDNGILDLYRGELDRARGGIPEISENPSSYFTDDLYSNSYNTARDTKRRGLNTEFDEFAADGFAYDRFNDTADDQFLSAILDDQYGAANTEIEAARARGTLNDTAYGAATTELARQQRGGQSQLNDIGGGVLEGFREQLRNSASGTRDRISNFDFGDNLNLGSAGQRLTSLGDSLSGRLEGDIYNAIGNTQLFDTQGLLGRAEARGGIVNPTAPAAIAPTTDDDENNNLGTQGVF